MQIFRKLCLAVIATALSFTYCKAQVIILEKNALDKIKDGYTHVIVTSKDFPDANDFLAVFKKYWTVTKGVDLVTANEVDGNLVAGDSYFMLQEFTYRSSNGASAVYIYLDLGMPTKRDVEKKKSWKTAVDQSLAHIELSADLSTMLAGYFKQKSLDFDFDGGGHLYHWGPGFLKNYLVQLSTSIQTGKKNETPEEIKDKASLQNLKTQTLYCPEDNLHKMGTFVKEGKMVDPKDAFEDYKYQYKVVTDKELNDMILDDTKEVYYLLFVRNSTGKFVAVIDSKTGAIVYSSYDKGAFSMGSNLKSSDLKDLYKVVNKN